MLRGGRVVKVHATGAVECVLWTAGEVSVGRTESWYLPVLPNLDVSARSAIAAADAARFLAAGRGHDVDDALQQVGAGIPMALKQRREQAEPVAVSVINRLTWRADRG